MTNESPWPKRAALVLVAAIVLQSAIRLVALSPVVQHLPLQLALAHGLDLAGLAGLALVALVLSGRRRLPRLALAIALALIGTLLLAFDLSTWLSLAAGQRTMSLPTAKALTCGLGGMGTCAAQFPLATLALVLFVLALTGLTYSAAGWLAPRVQTFARRPFALLALVLLIAAPAMAWLMRPAMMAAFEPLFRFVTKGEFPAQPTELTTIPRPDYHVAPSPGIKPRTLVLIIVDSLRADAAQLAPGPSRTPFLQSLAAGGHLHDFGPAAALCATSYCGITGILSSSDWATLRHGPPLMLPDVLAANGYRSYFLLSGPHRRAYNMAALYGPHVDVLLDDSSADSKGLVDDRDQVRRLHDLALIDPARSFVYIHLMSAHGAGLRFGAANQPASLLARLFGNSSARQDYPAFYNRGVAQADAIIRELFAEFAARGLGDALVVITADHGERLSGTIGHGGVVDLDTALVPLLVYDPRDVVWPVPGPGVPATIDAAPTLLDAAGITVPSLWRGSPLQQGVTRPNASSESQNEAAQVMRAGSGWQMIRCPRDKPRATCTRLESVKR